MVEITNVKVYELEESVIASRNAFRVHGPDYSQEEFDKSIDRASKLANFPTNSGHCNFLTGIRVAFDIKYPQYFTPQLQRYHFIDIITSTSKDHRLAKIASADCFNKYVDEVAKANLQKYVDAYNANPCYETYIPMLSNCPLGLELVMRCNTNYMQLRTIYNQRKNKDRLKEDWDAFCDMIEKLPYFEEFILKGTKVNKKEEEK